MRRTAACLFACFLVLVPQWSFAQGNAQRGRLIVTVADPSGAVVADATVTLTGLETATKTTPAPVKSNDKGIATFENLPLGRYAATAEFPGFELGLLRDFKINRGDNKHLVILPLRGLNESVTVGRDSEEAASTRTQLGSALTREQLEELSDDPDEMRRQLGELAGQNATIRVDSFEGQQLPPKSQIKAIHITRDQYAAENHYIGGLFIDIITQPGVGTIRGNASFGYNSSALNGRTEFTPVKGPEMQRNGNFGFGGTIIPRKLDLSANVFATNNYTTPNTYTNSGNGIRSDVLNLRVPQQNMSVSSTMNWAVTRDQTIRLSGNVGGGHQDNLGVGGYDLIERSYSTKNRSFGVMFQEAGPLGRRWFTNTRMRLSGTRNAAKSAVEVPTIVVQDAFTTGGAQRAGETTSKIMTVQSDLDYVRGRNSYRVGVMLESYWYHSTDTSNYLGTFTFTSNDAYHAGQPTYFTRRIGDPLIEYSNHQFGVYFQDDFRVSKRLTISPGLRYEVQTHVTDYNGWAPRIGFTWSPFKNGKTTVRGGGGISYDWLSSGTYAQTIRVDGVHQQDLTIPNPSYPDPGTIGDVRASSRYQLGTDYVLPRSVSVVFGADYRINSRSNVGASYTERRTSQTARGRNLNTPINGVRPDPRYLNIIETVSDADAKSREFYVSYGVSILAPSPANNQARFNWKRMSFNWYYGYSPRWNNSDGPFSVPASGTLDTEWGPAIGSRAHFVNFNISSSQIKNVNFGVSWNGSSGGYYNVTTGFDDNRDLFFNDRPAGVPRNAAQEPNWTQQLTARAGYTWTFGRGSSSAPQGIMINGGGVGGFTVTSAAPAANRYRISINVNALNITNHSNYGGYSGVQTSPFYGIATTSGQPRRILVNMNFGF